jgi:hypothetical protein
VIVGKKPRGVQRIRILTGSLWRKYTIYAKVCGHPFQLVFSALSATPIADRCKNQAHSHAISIDKHWQ